MVRKVEVEYEVEVESKLEIEYNIKKEILNSVSWYESIAMKKKVDNIKSLLIKFLDEQELLVGEGNGLNRDINDIKNHFSNWLNKELKELDKHKTKETPKTINFKKEFGYEQR